MGDLIFGQGAGVRLARLSGFVLSSFNWTLGFGKVCQPWPLSAVIARLWGCSNEPAM